MPRFGDLIYTEQKTNLVRGLQVHQEFSRGDIIASVASYFNHVPLDWDRIGQSLESDVSAGRYRPTELTLPGFIAETHVQESLLEVCTKFDPNTDFHPIRNGLSTPHYLFDTRNGRVEVRRRNFERPKESQLITDYDALVRMAGILVLWEVKLGGLLADTGWSKRLKTRDAMDLTRARERIAPLKEIDSKPPAFIWLVYPEARRRKSLVQRILRAAGAYIVSWPMAEEEFLQEVRTRFQKGF